MNANESVQGRRDSVHDRSDGRGEDEQRLRSVTEDLWVSLTE